MVNVTQRSNSPPRQCIVDALTGFALSAAAQAALPAEDMTGVKVTYGDLNFTSKHGNQVLLARIAQGRDSGERGVRAGGHASCDPRVTRSHAQIIGRRGAAQS